ncbi:hypothetical protein QYE76_026546 [Lolium multiflorum]|uniref:F-box domain-containing protein n=1 Tax=Lolium multiflorum TaxID=4521 RepID=A0AAD8RJU9_LOLMU|nr:hypothetical protein QYE76_026546 [Lolium multiflorum]
MEETTEEAMLLPDDVVRKILLRVATVDVVSLFRCALSCKQWRALVADVSFLQNHWPENRCHPSSLLGFFDKRYDDGESPIFSPVSPGSELGPRRRYLTSFVPDAPDGILDDAVPLAARGGLLLVLLITGRLGSDSFHLAVCDILAGTCDVLPPLGCAISQFGCAVVAREDCFSLDVQQGQTPLPCYSAFFKVLAMVIERNDKGCNLYTFSSSEPNWSEPRKCLDEVWQRDDISCLQIRTGTTRVILCRGVAYWLGSYSTDPGNLPLYFTIGVNVKTGQTSSTELSIPANQTALSSFGLMLSVAVDGNLSLLHLEKEGFRLNTWTRGDNGTWIRTRVIELKPPKKVWDPVYVSILSGGKSGALFMSDMYGHVYKADPETGVMEDVTAEMFQGSLGIMAVPIEIDWPALFMSRLSV